MKSSMRQRVLPFVARRSAKSRRRADVRSRVPHRARPAHARRVPLHVTLKLVDGLPSLRERDAQRVLRVALHRGAERFGLRVVHYAALSNHLHIVCEAEDAAALARGVKGLAVRIARNVNRHWKRRGTFFAERYHARALYTPREVRNALAYVLGNARKHGLKLATVLDTCSSASTFDGWVEHGPLRAPWLARAGTWLLALGWRRHGLLSVLGAPTRAP
jgi:hypothetical protein